MVYFCFNCFKQISRDAPLCPFCGADIQKYTTNSFEEKLIHALHHPLPDIVGIAITVLGKIKSKKAVKPLKGLFHSTSDPYIQREILDALFAIGTKDALRFVTMMLAHENVIVRKEAEFLIKKMG
ncbi:MAG: HEAT repeat domain-containing protein [Spirochaetes bacterium]|nr:HEAT repeat domain-containing protein [Spirochaetota bacterium]